jgi:hypothetical protein
VKRRAWAYIRCVGCAAAAFALFAGWTLAQPNSKEKSLQATSTAAASQESPVAIFQAHADLVLIPLTVTDTLNRFVLGLQKEDFRLSEDGVESNSTPIRAFPKGY